MQFSQEQQLIQDMAKSFAQQQIKPFAAQWDEKGIFPRETLNQMGQLGFMGMLIPEQWGAQILEHWPMYWPWRKLQQPTVPHRPL